MYCKAKHIPKGEACQEEAHEKQKNLKIESTQYLRLFFIGGDDDPGLINTTCIKNRYSFYNLLQNN